jgi:hypothetical protein
MDINWLALQLNTASVNFKIGALQEIRQKIKGLKRRPGSGIFHASTISDDGWAFHYGGRTEIQYNIGIEEDGIRYGLAFSLETSQSLPDISALYPKILKLNCMIRENPELFSEYKIWYWHKRQRSVPFCMGEIPIEIIKPATFIFFGKLIPDNNLDINEILLEFDKMLLIYLAVESRNENVILSQENQETKFQFLKQNRNLVVSRAFSSVEIETNIDVRHSKIQNKLRELLEEKHGKENVSIENPFLGNLIDAVVNQNSKYLFFEVKTANSAKSCIRQAIGQLFEYAYWPGFRNADGLIIVGEHPLLENDQKYLQFLNTEFSIPLSYMQVPI